MVRHGKVYGKVEASQPPRFGISTTEKRFVPSTYFRDQSEGLFFAHEVGQIRVYNSVALLKRVAAGEDVFGIVVLNLLQRSVFPLFCLAAGHHGHAHLNIRIPFVATAKNEVAFKRTDTPDTCGIAMCSGIRIDDVFKDGAIV